MYEYITKQPLVWGELAGYFEAFGADFATIF